MAISGRLLVRITDRTYEQRRLVDFDVAKSWCGMPRMIEKSKTAKRFMRLTYAIGLLALAIRELPEILAVILK